jgi:phosphate transport system substrate-binding protein
MCKRRPSVLLCLIALSLCSTMSCSQSSRETGPVTVSIQGAGATFPAPLYLKWIEEYQRSFPEVRIEYDVVGSGEGIDRFLSGAVDFGASDAPLTDEQRHGIERGLVLIPATAGSIAIAYHPAIPDGVRFSRANLVDVFLGKIERWNDPRILADNPGLDLPDQPMQVVVRDDSSGTTFAFTNHLAATSNEWRDGPGVGKSIYDPKGALRAQGNAGVASRIKATRNSLGYVESGAAKRAGLHVALLENKDGAYVKPTGTSGLSTLIHAKLDEDLRVFLPDPSGPDSYPIVTYTWLLLYETYEDEQRSRALKDFVAWCLDEGQQYNESLGYIRLAPQVVALASKSLNRISE